MAAVPVNRIGCVQVFSGCGVEARGDPAPPFLRQLSQQDASTGRDRGRNAPSVAVGAGQRLPAGVCAGRDARLAVPRHVGVEVDDVRDPFGGPVGRAGDDHPP